MGEPGDQGFDRPNESEGDPPSDAPPTFHRSGKDLSEYPMRTDNDPSGCLFALIIVVVLIVVFLVWYSSWSCGPGRGKCSFVSMTSTSVVSVEYHS